MITKLLASVTIFDYNYSIATDIRRCGEAKRVPALAGVARGRNQARDKPPETLLPRATVNDAKAPQQGAGGGAKKKHPQATGHQVIHPPRQGRDTRSQPQETMDYPVIIEPDGNTWMARFPDVPEALTGGDTQEEALSEALGALVTAFEFYFEDGRPVPLPSQPEAGQPVVSVPPSLWAKVLLLNAMCESSVSQAELARRLGMPRQNVQRLTDLHHVTKIDQLAAAVSALGHRLELVIR